MESSDDRGSHEYGFEGASPADSRRWLRDLGALLALPALWVDHEPDEIVAGLLSVLFGVLQLDGGYARFDEMAGRRLLELWRPLGTEPPVELQSSLTAARAAGAGISTSEVTGRAGVPLRVATLPISVPWATGLVIVSASRPDFPTALETHLLRAAVGQAAIAIRTAQRLARERADRATAEHALAEQTALLRSLLDEVEPTLVAIASQLQEATRAFAEVQQADPESPSARELMLPGGYERGSIGVVVQPTTPPLSRRETEVLGLLAQGLSNKEIAGTMWLSDRTVERHITSLYRKIGVARRSEATAFALRHGVGS